MKKFKQLLEQHREKGRFKPVEPKMVKNTGIVSPRPSNDSANVKLHDEEVEHLEEKNVPTSPEKWAQAKAQAKAKFDVYPSAYANGWAAKKYKAMGGGWKSVSEEKNVEDLTGDSLGAMTLKDKPNREPMKKLKEFINKEEDEQIDEGAFKRIATDAEEDARLAKSKSWKKETPWMKSQGTVTDKSGAKHTPMSRARDLARAAAKKKMQESAVIKTNKEVGSRVSDIGPGGKEHNVKTDSAYTKYRKMGSSSANARARAAGEKNAHMFESRVADIVREAAEKAKAKKQTKKEKNDNSDTFQKDPELGTTLSKNVQ